MNHRWVCGAKWGMHFGIEVVAQRDYSASIRKIHLSALNGDAGSPSAL